MKYAVIGGGIVGLAIAREIKLKKLGEVSLLEKESGLGMHASTRNSGVIHSGINHTPESLKARLCVLGSSRLRGYCRLHDITIKECGTLVIARNEKEEQGLETLLSEGIQNRVQNLEIIAPAQIEKIEPLAVRNRKALYSPHGAIVDCAQLISFIGSEIHKARVEIVPECKVTGIKDKTIHTTKGDYEVDYFINCAGLYADKIAHSCGVGKDFRIVPFRGDYYRTELPLDKMIYPYPDKRFPFLGVHLTPTTDEQVIVGPTANLSWRGRESYNGEFSFRELFGLLTGRHFWGMPFSNSGFLEQALKNFRISLSRDYFVQEVNSLMHGGISADKLRPYRSGIRAQLVHRNGKLVEDFVFEKSEYGLHILNAVSPGLTSSFAFAEHVVENYLRQRNIS